MPKISILELFIGLIPEAIVFMFGGYILTRTKLEVKKILCFGIIIGFISYLIRLMPVIPGISIIFIVITVTLFLVIISRVDVMKTIPAVLTLFVLRLGTEWLNVMLLEKVLNLPLEEIFKNPVAKTIAGMPSFLVFALIIFILYRVRYLKAQEC